MELRCYGCMQVKQGRPVCEHCGWDERRQNESHQLPVGTVLENKYVVGRMLGQGGFGITYIGWDTMLDIPIAIKEYFPTGLVMRESTVSTQVTTYGGTLDRFHESRERFLREAKALAKFSSIPQIVHIYNFFQANNTAYIIMEYAEGVTLRDFVRKNGTLSQEQTLFLLGPILIGLEQLHREGIIHRDISPDNIMLLPKGGAKLLDFGAVRDVSGAVPGEDASKSTMAILKQGYAPIEQYRGKGDMGPWTDVYALCATIVYCLTGKTPPDATERMMARMSGEDDGLHFAEIAPGNPALQKALEHGMAHVAVNRTRSVAQLVEEMTLKDPAAERKEQEARELAERQRREQEAREKAEQERREREAREKADRERRVREAGEKAEWERREREARERERKEREAREKAERERREREAREQSKAQAIERVKVQVKKNAARWGKKILFLLLLLVAGIVGAAVLHAAMPILRYNENGNRVLAGVAGNNTSITDGSSAFGTKVSRKDVLHITFLASVEGAASDAVDASQDKDRSVLAWTEEVEGGYDLFIAAETGVIAPESCENLFRSFINVKTITFAGVFDTSRVRDMNGMFSNCRSLELLDIGDWDTSQVVDMDSMFQSCQSLAALNVGAWDTASVRYMNSMFSDCSGLEELLIDEWDISAVTDMSYMFCRCNSLKERPISDSDISESTNTFMMFGGRSSLMD